MSVNIYIQNASFTLSARDANHNVISKNFWIQVTRMIEWTDIAITFFTAVLAIVAIIQYKAYRLMSRPIIFASLRDNEEPPGIRVENAGNGIAWNGNVKVTALTSKIEYNYRFIRLYGRNRYEYPTEGQSKFPFDPERDKRVKINITYGDKEQGRKKYHWEAEFDLHKGWLTPKRDIK